MPARKGVRYAENPFLKELVDVSQPTIKKVTSPIKSDDMLLVSRETGEIATDTGLGMVFTKTVEANEFVKIYAAGVAAMFGLKTAGKKMFTVLFNQVAGKDGKDSDKVTLYYPILPEEVKAAISYRTFCRGIEDLIKNHFIAESLAPSQFFVNPTFMYNGDRLAMVTVYKKKTTDERAERLKKENEAAMKEDEEATAKLKIASPIKEEVKE